MKTISRYIMTLALLLTAVTGAWATVYSGQVSRESLQVGDILVKGAEVTSETPNYGLYGGSYKLNGSISSGLANVKKNLPVIGDDGLILVGTVNFTPYDADNDRNGNAWKVVETGNQDYGVILAGTTYVASITVEPGSSANTWTFAMPGSDVVLTPQYAPAAKWDVENAGTTEEKVLLPAALEGIIAGQDAAIVTAGQSAQGTVMYAVTTTAEAAPALTAFSATLPTAKDITTAGDVYVWYYIKGADAPQGQTATAENTFNDSEICTTPLKVTVLNNKFDIQFKAANANTIESGKATVTVGGKTATVTEGKLESVKMGSEVKVKANTGYKFRKVEVKKGGGEPVLLTTITAADNSSFKSGSQTFGDVATVTLTGDNLTNDGSHGGWYCLGSNLTATISVAEANGANITSVKFYTAGGGSAEDKEAPFEVTTTSMSSSDITTYLNGNAIGSYGVSKIEVYGTK